MKKMSLYLLAMMFLMSSCAVVGGIFKAGMVWGIIVVVLVVVGIIALITRGTRK